VTRKRVRLKIGTYPQTTLGKAWDLARDVLAEVDRGRDPRLVRKELEESSTFGELAAAWVELYAKPRLRCWQREEERIKRDLVPAIGDLKVRSMRRRDIVLRVVDPLMARGRGVTANRAVGLARRIFNWGLERELVEENPCLGIRRPFKEQPRQGALFGVEVGEAATMLSAEDSESARAFLLILYTGVRGGEAFGLTWGEIEGEWWTLPADRNKSKRERRIYLSPQARAVLEAQRQSRPGTSSVFPSRWQDIPIKTWGVAERRFRERLKRAHFGTHLLRKTVASGLAKLGVLPHVRDEVLGHARRTVGDRHYNMYTYADEVKAALDLWGGHVQLLASGDRGAAVEPSHD
jgi:integrase